MPCHSLQADPKFFAVRKLLAAAPASGEPRAKFAASLLKGIDSAAEDDSSSVFGSARMLLEVGWAAGPLCGLACVLHALRL
jgi:hypothetical protein